MNLVAVLVGIKLLELTGPDGQFVELNPASIVSLREPRRAEHFASGIKCLIFTTDNKYLAVIQPCKDVVDAVIKSKEQGR